MLWYFTVLSLFIFTAGQSLYIRKYSESSKIPETFPPAISYILVLTPISILVGLFMPHHITWSYWLIFLLLIEGLFIGLFNWMMFSALKRLPVAKFELIFQLYIVVVVILGWTLLGEKLNSIQIAGGILLLFASYIAISAPEDSKSQLKKHASKKAIIIALLAALFLGIGLVAEKAALRHMDVGAYFIVGFLTQTLALLIITLKDLNKHSLKIIKKADIKSSSVMGLLSAIVGFSYIASIKLSNNVSLITLLSAFILPLTVVAAYIFLRERENMARLWLATIIGTIGLVIVII